MNTIDIISLVLITLLTLLGLWHGFLRGIFRLLAWAAGVIGAYFATDLLSEFVSKILETSDFSTGLVCKCIGFIVPFLLLLFIGHLVNKAIKGTVASKTNRILGGVFGAIKAIIIMFVILTILHILPFGGAIIDARDNSTSYTVYKACLKFAGYSTEPIDLMGIAEDKASSITKSITEKAADKASDIAKDVTDQVVEKATNTAKEAASNAAKKALNSD